MMKLLLVGAGGFLGSVLRYLVSGVVQNASHSASFPFGTLAVNVAGCFAIGAVSQLAESRGALSASTREFIVIGMFGGFTTFSTFGNESMNLLRGGENAFAMANVGAHIMLGLGAIWLGRSVAYLIWR